MRATAEESVAEVGSLFFDLRFSKWKRNVTAVLSIHPYFREEWVLEREEIAPALFDVAEFGRALRSPGSWNLFLYTCSCGIADCGGWEPSSVVIDAAQITIVNESMPRLPLDLAGAISCYELFQRLSLELSDQDFSSMDVGTTPLIWAVANTQTFLVESLLFRRHRVDERDSIGRTALLHAAEAGSVQYVQLLLHAGANPNLGDQNGWTPLHASVDGSFFEIAELLLAAGSSPNIQDCLGDSALHRAARGDEVAIARSLARFGATSQKNNAGRRPVDICEREGGHEPMLDVLAEMEARAVLGHGLTRG